MKSNKRPKKSRRVLLVASTVGYQLRSFNEAADRLGVELVFATDRCYVLDDPWQDRAIPIRFDDEDGAVRNIKEALAGHPVVGFLAIGDRPAVIAALTSHALQFGGNPPEAVRIAGNKLLSRIRFREAGLPSPWFDSMPCNQGPENLMNRITFPCVVKPLEMAASQGVIRANTPDEFDAALNRVRGLSRLSDIRSLRTQQTMEVLIEGYIPGREVAVEGVLTGGLFQVFALFDKPDPLTGPFFEETIYVTPPSFSGEDTQRIIQTVSLAVTALGLTDGPVHAECRVNEKGVFILEVAARPIGGLCSKALRFHYSTQHDVSLEEVLLRHAVRQSVTAYRRETCAAGVMMIPIKKDGLYKRVSGLEEARAVDQIEEIIITAKVGQRIQPLPEGGSYLGFIFARADQANQVVQALRVAYDQLKFHVETSIPVM